MSRSVALLILIVSARASAQPNDDVKQPVTIDGTLTTLLAGKQDPRDGQLYTVVPVYETVSLIVEHLQLRNFAELRLVVSGWGELAFGSPREGTYNGDLDVAFLEATLFKRRLTVRVGRQMIFAGAARALQLDGASATWNIGRGFGVTAYGGVPVTPRFVVHQGDVAGGGRVFWRRSFDSEIGLSFIEVLDRGLIARQDLGVDARFRPARTLVLTGYALWNFTEERLAEGEAAASWQPHHILELRADFRHTAPDLFLPRTSILSVFASESHNEAGSEFYLRPLSRLRVSGDYHVIVDDDGTGHRGGIKLNLYTGAAFETSVGTEARVLHIADKGYVQLRFFAIRRVLPTLVITGDFDAYRLEQPINGQNVSYTTAGTIAWDFHPGWRAAVTGIADFTPFVEQRFECLVRLAYNHVFRVREVRK